MKMQKRLRITSLILIILLSPFVLFDRPGEWLSYQGVSASVGTCCKDDNSLCIIPPYQIPNRYAMSPNIPCPPQVEPPDKT